MRKSIGGLLSLLVILSACSKSNDANSSTTNLNSIENAIKGKWFLKSKADSTYINNALTVSTVVYTKFQGIPYVELKTTKSPTSALGGTKAKDTVDAGANLGSLELGAPISITSNGYWYYDETSKVIVWGGINLVPVKATNTELELKASYGDNSQIGFNFTWKFSR